MPILRKPECWDGWPLALPEYLLWQVRLSNFSESDEEIAEYLVRNTSPAGYLQDGSTVAVAMTSADGYPDGQPSAGIEKGDSLVFAIKILDVSN